MVFKNFRINIALRSVLLVATGLPVWQLGWQGQYPITAVALLLLAVAQVVSLVAYVERANRDVLHFLESIRYADFSRSFKPRGMGRSFDRLNQAFDLVLGEFHKLRAEKEEHYFYLQNIIQHIGIAILAYRPDGAIEMINNAGKRLFQVSSLKNLHELNHWNRDFVSLLLSMKAGENTLIKIQDQDDLLQLAVYATEFKVNDRAITLVSVKNIQAELEEQEMEAWQKLIRVLTHEIMNSIAPISSLTATATDLMQHVAQNLAQTSEPDTDLVEMVEDVQNALQTIHKRSHGLIHFVETYRNLTRIPKPNFSIFPVKNLFSNLHELLREDLRGGRIELHYQIEPENMLLTADEQLMEQVLLNLIKNSIQATADTPQPRIGLRAYHNARGRAVLQVLDNGVGMVEGVREKVFIPFFTTKPDGSGIGLSLSRQIVRQHNGTISLVSDPGRETCFTITL